MNDEIVLISHRVVLHRSGTPLELDNAEPIPVPRVAGTSGMAVWVRLALVAASAVALWLPLIASMRRQHRVDEGGILVLAVLIGTWVGFASAAALISSAKYLAQWRGTRWEVTRWKL